MNKKILLPVIFLMTQSKIFDGSLTITFFPFGDKSFSLSITDTFTFFLDDTFLCICVGSGCYIVLPVR